MYLTIPRIALINFTRFHSLRHFQITGDFFSCFRIMSSNLVIFTSLLNFTHLFNNFVLSLVKHMLHREDLRSKN